MNLARGSRQSSEPLLTLLQAVRRQRQDASHAEFVRPSHPQAKKAPEEKLSSGAWLIVS